MILKIKNFLSTFKAVLSSVDFWKIVFPVILVVVPWYLNEQSKLSWEQYKRKEENYKELIVSLKGFYVSNFDFELRQKFIEQLNVSWLYASDDVILTAYHFVSTVHTGNKYSDEERERAVSDLVLAIRKDLLSKKIIKNTTLTPENFKHLIATKK